MPTLAARHTREAVILKAFCRACLSRSLAAGLCPAYFFEWKKDVGSNSTILFESDGSNLKIRSLSSFFSALRGPFSPGKKGGRGCSNRAKTRAGLQKAAGILWGETGLAGRRFWLKNGF